MDSVKLAVNGTLMRGLPLEKNLLDAGAAFLREAATAPCYRLWSIHDNNPAMLRVDPADDFGAAAQCFDAGHQPAQHDESAAGGRKEQLNKGK